MKENVIFCYSGTGNCLDMAKNIAKRLGDTDIIMMRKYPAVTDVREAKRVGFVVPCYGGGLPGHVERYIRDIKVSPDAYTFGIGQCAAYKGEGLSKINSIIPLKYWAVVTHQCTCIWLFPHDLMMPKMDAQSAQKRSEELAKGIAQDVVNRVKTEKNPPYNVLNVIENRGWPAIAAKKTAQFKVSDACIACGTCAALCPRKNIVIENGKAKIGNNCAQCLGCLQYCPKNAISIGAITDKREHYHNPNITPDDLNQSVIHVD